MENISISILGLHSTTCTEKIENSLSKERGISKVSVSFSTNLADIFFDENLINQKRIHQVIKKTGYKIDKKSKIKDSKKQKKAVNKWLLQSIISAIITIIIATSPLFIYRFEWLSVELINPILFLLTSTVFLLGGVFIIKSSYLNIKNKKLTINLLPGIAISALFIYALFLTSIPSLMVEVSRLVLFITLSGIIVILNLINLSEKYFKSKIKNITNILSKNNPKKARVIRNGSEVEIDIQDLKVGDILKIEKGEIIPADGIITEGETIINEENITGDNKEISKFPGNEVIILSINLGNTIIVKTTQTGSESLLEQIKSLTKEPQSQQASSQIVTKRAYVILVVISLLLGIGTSLAWYFIEGSFHMSLMIFVSMLLIVNPEILKLSAILNYKIGLNYFATNGTLFKGGKTVENATKINRIVFDKTGVLTLGVPEIDNIVPKEAFNENRLLILLGSLESTSSHPFAKAITSYVKERKLRFEKAHDVKEFDGLGIMGMIEGQEILAGNKKFMEESNVQMNEELLHKAEILSKNVRSPVFIAKNRQLIGIVGVSDTINEHAKETVTKLKKLGLRVSLITGDNIRIAENIGEQLRIKSIFADILQTEKVEQIKELQENKDFIAVVGDGLKDKGILEAADVGIAIGTGTDTNIKASDISIINEDLLKIVSAFKKANLIEKNVQQSVLIAFIYNMLAIVVASGVFYPLIHIVINPAIAVALSGAVYFMHNKKSLDLNKTLNS